jgi:hypothetical protein
MRLTRMAIYRFGIVFAVLTFVDFTGLLADSGFSTIIKYSYSLIMLMFIVVFILRWGTIDVQSKAPLLALLFFVMTSTILIANISSSNVSYASAFNATLIFAAAAFIPRNGVVVDANRIANQILILLLFGTTCYLLNALLKSGQSEDVQHVESIVCVLALCLAILVGQKIAAAAVCLMTAIALGLRPTSTLVLALIICVPLTVALRVRAIRFSRLFTNTILTVLILGPLAFYFFFEDIAEWTSAVDHAIKSDLGSFSNAEFRLAVLKAAFRSLDESSFWFGSGLSGDTSVSIVRELPIWIDTNRAGIASIHSDFVIVLTQSGIIGYVVFACFIYSIANIRIRRLAVLNADSIGTRALISISIVANVAIWIFASFNPFLQQYQFAHTVWMLMFISEVVMKTVALRAETARSMRLRARLVEPRHAQMPASP